MITIAVQVHNFQHRFAWQLSSLAHQITAMPITVDVSCTKNNGNPTTEYLADLYSSERLSINLNYYDIKELQYRGLTRNGALIRCRTDWLLFADCDMVYHPEYFGNLIATVNRLPDKHHCIFTAGRYSQPNELIEETNKIVGAERYDVRLSHPWKRADRRLAKKRRGNVGAGYFQLINMDKCEHDSFYVDATRNRDHGWIDGRGWAKANSDKQFRRRIGSIHKLPSWFSENQIHLNHERDNMFKKHLTQQR